MCQFLATGVPQLLYLWLLLSYACRIICKNLIKYLICHECLCVYLDILNLKKHQTVHTHCDFILCYFDIDKKYHAQCQLFKKQYDYIFCYGFYLFQQQPAGGMCGICPPGQFVITHHPEHKQKLHPSKYLSPCFTQYGSKKQAKIKIVRQEKISNKN